MTLQSFRRITGSGSYLPELDGLRFLAILSVISLHIYGELLTHGGPGLAAMEQPRGFLRLLGHSGYGVELFFVISGFIIALPFARMRLLGGRQVDISSYFLRRLSRLEPPYILTLLMRSMVLQATGVLTGLALLAHLLASIFYVHNLAYHFSSRIEAVSWTLEIEVQFYCLAPLLTLVYKLRRAWSRRVLLGLCIAAATPLQALFLPGWHSFQPGGTGLWNLSIVGSIQFFLIGLLLADLYTKDWGRFPHTWVWDVISVPGWYLMFWLPYHAFRFIGPFLLPILFVGAFKGRLVPGLLRHPVTSTIGGMCYSIYLTHRSTIGLAEPLLRRLHLPFAELLAVSLLLVIPASIVVGAVCFLWIERPCMDPAWPKRLMARLRSGWWVPWHSDPPDEGVSPAATR